MEVYNVRLFFIKKTAKFLRSYPRKATDQPSIPSQTVMNMAIPPCADFVCIFKMSIFRITIRNAALVSLRQQNLLDLMCNLTRTAFGIYGINL